MTQHVVFGYVRVSSVEQEDGYGPEVQEGAIRAFAALKGLPTPQIIHESQSGENLIERVVLRQIIQRCKEVMKAEKGNRAGIIFPKLDRLARQLTDQESVVAQALFYGYRLYSTVHAEDDLLAPGYAGDPFRVAMRQMMGTFAQLERTNIQGRLDGGLYEKAKQGGATGGATAFGYRMVNKEIEIDPDEAKAVIAVFVLENKGLTYKGIAAVMARDFPKLCGNWTATYISRVIARKPLYAEGIYKPRLAVDTVVRPELVILPRDESWAHYHAPAAAASTGVDWSKVPDPVALNTLALLLHMPATWLQSIIREHEMAVTWRKGRMLVPLQVAQQLEPIVLQRRVSKPTA